MPAIRLIARKTAICIASILLLAASAAAQLKTREITIGKLTYQASGTQTNSDGTIIEVGDYHVTLDTTGITAAPIVFKQAIVIVKGTRQSTLGPNFPTQITTGNGCSGTSYTLPLWLCEVVFTGGSGFVLAPCARVNTTTLVQTQNCISIAVQLVSLTGKNFSFALVDGEQFCAYGVNNTFVLAKPGQAALDPQCDAQGFCKGTSAPIILRAAPATSCTE